MPGQADWERLIRAQKELRRAAWHRQKSDGVSGLAKKVKHRAGSGGCLADLRRKIMVIDGIKVTAQPCVFLAINSAPTSPVSNPLAFAEPRMACEQLARSDNQPMPSSLWGG